MFPAKKCCLPGGFIFRLRIKTILKTMREKTSSNLVRRSVTAFGQAVHTNPRVRWASRPPGGDNSAVIAYKCKKPLDWRLFEMTTKTILDRSARGMPCRIRGNPERPAPSSAPAHRRRWHRSADHAVQRALHSTNWSWPFPR